MFPSEHMPMKCKTRGELQEYSRIFRSRSADGREVIVAPIIGHDGKVHRFAALF
jgi:hypothetical protein